MAVDQKQIKNFILGLEQYIYSDQVQYIDLLPNSGNKQIRTAKKFHRLFCLLNKINDNKTPSKSDRHWITKQKGLSTEEPYRYWVIQLCILFTYLKYNIWS